MMTFLALGLAFSLSAHAAPACTDRLAEALKTLDAAELPSSDGQIDACRPASDRASSTTALRTELVKARDQYASHLRIFTDAAARLARAVPSPEARVCDLPAAVAEIPGIAQALSQSESDLTTDADIVRRVADRFDRQYSRGILSRLFSGRTRNCARTQANVKALVRELRAAAEGCREDVDTSPYGKATEARRHQTALENNCKPGPCEAVNNGHDVRGETLYSIEYTAANGSWMIYAKDYMSSGKADSLRSLCDVENQRRTN